MVFIFLLLLLKYFKCGKHTLLCHSPMALLPLGRRGGPDCWPRPSPRRRPGPLLWPSYGPPSHHQNPHLYPPSDPLIAKNNQLLPTPTALPPDTFARWVSAEIAYMWTVCLLQCITEYVPKYFNHSTMYQFCHCIVHRAQTCLANYTMCSFTPGTQWLVMAAPLKIGLPLCCHFHAKFAFVNFNLLCSNSWKSGFFCLYLRLQPMCSRQVGVGKQFCEGQVVWVLASWVYSESFLCMGWPNCEQLKSLVTISEQLLARVNSFLLRKMLLTTKWLCQV